jgi:voltage-gated potassium channel
VITVVFATSWPLMALAEPADAPIVRPANYWWWFLITTTTVGYGDFFPVSAGGHLVGVYVIFGGIATITTLFAKLAAVLDRVKGLRMKGMISVDVSQHVVLLGYSPGRTERIIDELLADSGPSVVLCAWPEVDAHPIPDRDVHFVRGDLMDDGVLRRAGVHRAQSVLVDAHDDNEALAVVATVDHVAPQVHIVVALRDLGRATQIRYVNAGARCVQWHTPHMLTEELQSPGISQVYTALMTHGGENTYSIRLPATAAPLAFGDCQVALGRRHDATILAARAGDTLLVSPPWQTELPPGSVLYYVSQRRLTPEDLADAVSRPGLRAG